MMNSSSIRPANETDLPAINRAIEAAINTWHIPDRVKRLALPSYLYQPHDLTHLQLVVMEAMAGEIIAVAAWEPADPADLPPQASSGLLLHGLYVSPEQSRQGIGTQLLEEAHKAARQQRFDGLLIKAQADASPFFRAAGLTELPVIDPTRDFPNRFWQICE
jgi:GNAT superfamily N-acetyltransferase